MGKAKAKYNKDKVVNLHGTKDGSVKKKNKGSKFKSTPTDKMALINSSAGKMQNVLAAKGPQKNPPQSLRKANAQKHASSKQAVKSNANQSKQDSQNAKQHSTDKEYTFNQRYIYNLATKFNDSNMRHDTDDSTESTDFSSDLSTDDTFNSQSWSDTPDIFGRTLEDDSDENDEDFNGFEKDEDDEDEDEDEDEAEDEEGEEEKKKKRTISVAQLIKNFEAQKAKEKQLNNEEDQEEEEEEEEEGEEEDDDSDEEAIERKGVKVFRGLDLEAKKSDDNKKDQKEHNDDYEQDEYIESDDSNSDEDVDDVENDEGDKENEKADKKPKINVKDLIDTTTDEDKDYDSVQDSEDYGINLLLANTLEDDEDDEDFNEDDEDTDSDLLSSEEEIDEASDTDKQEMNKTTKKEVEKIFVNGKTKEAAQEEIDLEKRIVLIDNISKEISKKQLRKMFRLFGVVKECYMANFGKDFSEKLTAIGHILYETEESAQKAVKAMNGKMVGSQRLKVQTSYDDIPDDEIPKTVVVKKLNWIHKSDHMMNLFLRCGNITNMREFSDEKNTELGLSKGVGFITFETENLARSSLKLDGTKIAGRTMRVEPLHNYIKVTGDSKENLDKKDKKQGTKRASSNQNANKPLKKLKTNSEESVARNFEHEKNVKKQKKKQRENEEKQVTAFQGQKVQLKNKKKKNKLDKKKKQMSGKLLSKLAKV